ncbi:hypothetical protein SAMN05216215_108730 [Saccharopolyspora shandongensis]|uniref:MerR HTH family regulatory protein n=1 Tax=Saccharopolyspora shandongensis TaxID=418495 RepID=A0A1H3TNF7_9PSEU|nr:hypothetical protein [Saccharopolyspora shandongensis]SDZ51428.1 hypothetical protein SAMN05216215_108730 [Saccharopolyspora shandongensis]
MTRPPIVRYRDGRALVDRATLVRLTGRSERTIREHCPVVGRDGIRPLYDARQCGVILAAVPKRNRRAELRMTA